MNAWHPIPPGRRRDHAHRKRAVILLAVGVLAPVMCQAQPLSFSSGGGAKTLTISSADPGNDPDEVIDDSAELTWDATSIGAISKITVDTSVLGQSFSLFVSLDVTSGSGTEQPERQLIDGMSDSDLLRDIPTGAPNGTGTLTYRAVATAAEGNSTDNGSDIHTITYTILAQ